MLKLTLPEMFYVFGAFHGVFLASLLLLKRRALRTNIYLSLLVLLFSFYLVENVIYSSGYLRQLPHFFLATLPVIFLIGPLFFMYIRSSVDPNFRLRLSDGVHLVPFLADIALLSRFYALDAAIKIRIYDATFNSQAPFQFSIYFLAYAAYVLMAGGYFLVSFKLLSRAAAAANGHANKGKLKWLRWSSITLFSYMLIAVVMTLVSAAEPGSRNFTFHSNLILQTLLIHAVGYVAFLYPGLLQDPGLVEARKYQSSPIDPPLMEALKIRLQAILSERQPYLDSELSPTYFLDELKISKHHFSQLLTEGMNTTFYDLINACRIETAKKLLLSGSYDNAKIVHIAYDCGYSNKSSFLRNFKKATGMTPTEFRESVGVAVGN